MIDSVFQKNQEQVDSSGFGEVIIVELQPLER
jgi:hypothetical protein